MAGAVARLLEQLALGCRKRGFAVVDASSGQLPHHRLRGVPILAFEQDAQLGFPASFCSAIGDNIVDGQNNNGAGMPDNIAAGAHAPRLFHFIGGDAEHRTPVTDTGSEDVGLT